MNRKHVINLFLFSVIVLILSGCGQPSQPTNSENKQAESTNVTGQPKDSLTLAREKLNDIALFVSGLPVSKNSSIFELTQTPEWAEYSEEAKNAWARFDSVAASYTTFSKEEIKSPYDSIKTLFYPFSGPDFLFANIMFPNVDKMILIGLEGPGSIPHIDSTSKDSLKDILEMYKVAIEDVIQLSFFRTIDMKNELGNKSIDGTAPIIMLFLARVGKEIVEVNPMYLDKSGELTKVSESKGKRQATAVEIKYRNKGESKIRSVSYLSTNLADPTLSQNIGFMNFLKNIDNNVVTFVKSATYLMHKSYFSIIRNSCLEKSALILQDDSGIGFKFFKKEKWKIQLYGTYSKPIKLFEDFFEPDYLEAFKKGNVKPLKFRIGYSPKSNLLMALKK
jgi:hypothetical protein